MILRATLCKLLGAVPIEWMEDALRRNAVLHDAEMKLVLAKLEQAAPKPIKPKRKRKRSST
jgi:hypothetical protein